MNSAFNIQTNSSTLAVSIWSDNIGQTLYTNKHLRVAFYQQFSNYTEIPIPAVNCSDFFANEIEQSEVYSEFFTNTLDTNVE